MTYRSVLGLRHQKVEDGCLDTTPDNEDNVRFPADRLKRHRPGELVEQAASVDSQRRKCHALRTHLEGKDLNRVQSLQGRKTDGVNGTKNEYEGHGGLGSSGVGLM